METNSGKIKKKIVHWSIM